MPQAPTNPSPNHPPASEVVVLISANAEWRATLAHLPGAEVETSPLGQWFRWSPGAGTSPMLYFHGGWGKISAAATAQYVIDHAAPRLVANLGTCGGFAGDITPGEVILVERALVYDILEQMGDAAEAIAAYTTDLDLSWLAEPYPQPVRRGLLISGDRDLVVEDLPRLRAEHGAVAGDWESGAIAWVAAHNHVPCLILRGVSDLVGPDGGEAYGDYARFEDATGAIMARLIDALPTWLAQARLR